MDFIYWICDVLKHQPWYYAELPDPFGDGWCP